MIQRFIQSLRTVKLGLKNVRAHKLRSALTVLGIVFGVCSVISMLAIGRGASQEVLEQLKSLGTQNIIVRSLKPPDDPAARTARGGGGGFSNVVDYGLRYEDAARLASVLPSVNVHVPIKSLVTAARHGAQEEQVTVLGTVPWYPQTANLEVEKPGRFITHLDMMDAANVCVIGKDLAHKLFFYHDPLGQVVSFGNYAYTVVGVARDPKTSSVEGIADLPSQNVDAFVPLRTLQVYEGDLSRLQQSGSTSTEYIELHQLILKVDSIEKVVPTAEFVRRDLERWHPQMDYELIVPFQLLKNAERTQRIFTIVLGSIAAISLLVGGIGIMNIMLASVSERTREIGIRRALGARQRDIMLQFLVECMILSIGGGLIGMGLGAGIPKAVQTFTDMKTVLTASAFIIAFGVSVAIGIIFGLYPARRAALMDPIDALRHE